MTKFITTLLLAASISTSIYADTDEKQEPSKQQNLFEKIFNTNAYDDGCDTYPLCEVDMSEVDQMELEDERSEKTDLETQSTDTKETK